ncbi:hypothetical protein CEP53_005417 [Fusarium sp. AF-6]|nr:hypothetical protein CEP53_005417 [Fusarium sp. AF-6]
MPLVVSSNLGILNPPSGSKATDTFLHFKRLPLELQWHIWELELKHERLLHVEARPLADNDSFKTTDCQQRPYRIILTEFQPISKLNHVNSESRVIASRFYRVQLPCLYRWEGRNDVVGTFYFNPELDTLEIRGQSFAAFAQDLWVHDVRHVGLVNLALSERRFIGMPPEPMVEYSLLHKVFSRLRNVVFLYAGGVERMFLGESMLVEPRRTNPMAKKGIYLSRPIMPAIPKFDRLTDDPRSSTGPSLNRIYFGGPDPRKLIHKWFGLLAKCNVQHTHKVDYRFLVAFGGRSLHPFRDQDDFRVDPGWLPRRDVNPMITCRHDAIKWAEKQDEEWTETMRRIRKEEDEDIIAEVYREFEMPLRPAIGFWLFPIEALGPLPDASNSLPHHVTLPGGQRLHWKFDLSGYKPQLCLSYLP